MFTSVLTGLFAIVQKAAISYMPVFIVGAFMDALDEVMETLLEKYEKKAKETPEKADDRRGALYRKYWDGFKERLRKAA